MSPTGVMAPTSAGDPCPLRNRERTSFAHLTMSQKCPDRPPGPMISHKSREYPEEWVSSGRARTIPFMFFTPQAIGRPSLGTLFLSTNMPSLSKRCAVSRMSITECDENLTELPPAAE